jgi:hypothetical protein
MAMASRGPTPELVQCPHCGTRNSVVEDRCQSCEKPLAIFIGPPEPLRRFSIGSLMALVALVAVGLALMKTSVTLGAFFLAWLVPALVRTFHAWARRKADGRPLVGPEVFGEFIVSAVVILMIGLASGSVFAVVSLVGFWLGALAHAVVLGDSTPGGELWGMVVGTPLGLVAGGLVAIFLLRRLWSTDP